MKEQTKVLVMETYFKFLTHEVLNPQGLAGSIGPSSVFGITAPEDCVELKAIIDQAVALESFLDSYPDQSDNGLSLLGGESE
jgi:hypothetical protein